MRVCDNCKKKLPKFFGRRKRLKAELYIRQIHGRKIIDLEFCSERCALNFCERKEVKILC